MRNPYYNASHCADPTAYEAIKNVTRDERRRKHNRRRRKKYSYPHKPLNIPVVRPKIKEVPPCPKP